MSETTASSGDHGLEHVYLDDPNPANLALRIAAPENRESRWTPLKGQVVDLFEWVLATRLAQFFMGWLALTPVLDYLSDILTAANFFWEEHVWWGTATLAIVYLSSRFTVLYLALLPMPDAWNIFYLFVPGLWHKAIGNSGGPPSANVLQSASVDRRNVR
ncbi:unnamed protein product, partial [Pylaiella littoralis]